MIYFIRCPLTRRVKIGLSDDPWARFSQIQTGSPTDLVLAAVLDGDRSTEAALHAQFSEQYVRGEWFAETGALAEYIAKLPPAVKPRRTRVSKTALCAWMAKNNVLNRELANQLGVGAPFISHMRNGQRQPLLPLAVKLSRITGLPVESFVIEDAA